MVFENLLALHIAIEKDCPPETAFLWLDRLLDGKKNPKIPDFPWTIFDIEDIKKLKSQGITYREISTYYGVHPSNISRQIKLLNQNKKIAAEAAKLKKSHV